MGTQKKIHLFCEGLRQINRPIFYKINFRAKTIARLGPDFMRYIACPQTHHLLQWHKDILQRGGIHNHIRHGHK